MTLARPAEPRVKVRILGASTAGPLLRSTPLQSTPLQGTGPRNPGVRLQGLMLDRGRWLDVDVRLVEASAGSTICADVADAARFARLHGDALSLVPRVHAVDRFEGGILVVSDPVRGLPLNAVSPRPWAVPAVLEVLASFAEMLLAVDELRDDAAGWDRHMRHRSLSADTIWLAPEGHLQSLGFDPVEGAVAVPFQRGRGGDVPAGDVHAAGVLALALLGAPPLGDLGPNAYEAAVARCLASLDLPLDVAAILASALRFRPVDRVRPGPLAARTRSAGASADALKALAADNQMARWAVDEHHRLAGRELEIGTGIQHSGRVHSLPMRGPSWPMDATTSEEAPPPPRPADRSADLPFRRLSTPEPRQEPVFSAERSAPASDPAFWPPNVRHAANDVLLPRERRPKRIYHARVPGMKGRLKRRRRRVRTRRPGWVSGLMVAVLVFSATVGVLAWWVG